MKILYITTHLDKGGIASYLSSLALGLKNKGHSVMVASAGGESMDFLLRNNIKHLQIPILTKKEVSPSVLFSFFILKKFLSSNPVDIIHAHTRVTQVLASFLSKKFRIPMVTTCHGFFKPRWHRIKFPCWGNKVIAISSQVKKHLISDFKVNEKNICLIHHGMDLARPRDYTTEEINNLKAEMGIPRGLLVVGVVARFSTVKGLEYFVKSIPLVLKENDKVIFLLLGYGEEESRLRQIAKDLKVEERLIFFRPVKDSLEYLCVLDIFVMPSIQEGLGLSILEAQLQKIPVIASNVGGILDIIDNNVTGILVEPRDELAISGAILKLIRERTLYSNIKNNAYDKILKEFTLEQMIEKTEKVYQELLCRTK
jgi:glycosyltransferase involved in cell wall biosynthesis